MYSVPLPTSHYTAGMWSFLCMSGVCSCNYFLFSLQGEYLRNENS